MSIDIQVHGTGKYRQDIQTIIIHTELTVCSSPLPEQHCILNIQEQREQIQQHSRQVCTLLHQHQSIVAYGSVIEALSLLFVFLIIDTLYEYMYLCCLSLHFKNIPYPMNACNPPHNNVPDLHARRTHDYLQLIFRALCRRLLLTLCHSCYYSVQ